LSHVSDVAEEDAKKVRVLGEGPNTNAEKGADFVRVVFIVETGH